MSDNKRRNKPRPKLCKLADKYTGWVGEGCWTAKGRRFIKRLQTRHNRRILNKEMDK